MCSGISVWQGQHSFPLITIFIIALAPRFREFPIATMPPPIFKCIWVCRVHSNSGYSLLKLLVWSNFCAASPELLMKGQHFNHSRNQGRWSRSPWRCAEQMLEIHLLHLWVGQAIQPTSPRLPACYLFPFFHLWQSVSRLCSSCSLWISHFGLRLNMQRRQPFQPG